MQPLKYYFKKYITGFDEPAKGRSTVKEQNSMMGQQVYHVETIQPSLLRKIALREPLVLKAIYKKNKDTIRNWFVIKNYDSSKSVPDNVIKLLNDFDKRTNFKNKLFIAGACANMYGTGFLERTYMESNNTKPDSPVKKGSKPLNLIPLNSELITKKEYHPTKKDGILYYVYEQSMSDKKYIHPDRIIDLTIDKLPHSPFGISKVDVLLNILKSKMNADVSSGEIISWFGHGILDMTITNMNDEEQKEMLKLYKKHPSYYVHNEDYELKVHNPTQLDPEPFYKYFYNNIASAFEMPTHILIGQQLGNVTGSEIGISDYYNDIENIQELIFTPLIEKIYTDLLESYGMKWDYVIDWNPIFVDELSEAKIMQTRTYSAVQLFNSGIIDLSESREVVNEGTLELDVNKEIEQDDPEDDTIPVTDPNIEPQPVDKKPTIKNSFLQRINNEQIKMIREAGEKELVEQEKRLKEAEKRMKKK